MSWTRVKEIGQAVSQRVTIFDVEKDLQSDKALKQIRQNAAREPAQLVFDPELFQDSQDELKFHRHTLSRDQLHEYAKVASSIRKAISLKVSHMAEEIKDQSQQIEHQINLPMFAEGFQLEKRSPEDFLVKTNPANPNKK